MPIKLSKEDQEFRNRQITPIDAKVVDLERMLVNLFMLVKYNGKRPVARSSRTLITLQDLRERLTADVTRQRGLAAYPVIIEKWLASDLVDMVYRGVPGKEAVASPRPLHLDAYRLRNSKHTRDYNASDQIYGLLQYADPSVIDALRTLFESDENSQAANGRLDLDTLVVQRLVTGPDLRDYAGSPRSELSTQPLSPAAAYLLTDDMQRLLAYKAVVPRHVLLDYLTTLLGVHLGLYMLRLFHLLPGYVRAGEMGGDCPHCHGPHADDFMATCRYKPLLLVDMGKDARGTMAALAQDNAAAHYARINNYIRAVFTINQLLSSITSDYQWHGGLASVADALAFYKEPPPHFQSMFHVRVNSLFQDLKRQRDEAAEQTANPRACAREMAQWAEIDAIRDMKLSPFDTFIEVVTYARTPFHRQYHVQLVDSLLQKNDESGLLLQGRARANARRFHIGSRLLEALAQIAVLEPDSSGSPQGYRTRPMLVDEFVDWLRDRYGLVINGLDLPDLARNAGVRELEAFRDNLVAFKGRLREIGFYTDMSDAYNGQTIRPRYSLEQPV